MKRNKPLKRYTLLRGNPQKIREWQQRSRKPVSRPKLTRSGGLAPRSRKRANQEREYNDDRPAFLAAHPICPVTLQRTTQVHHSAKREGLWLNLRRYWIAVSLDGHRIIEDNKKWAEGVGLMVRIRGTYNDHVKSLEDSGVSLTEPLFYLNWTGEKLCPPH